MDKEHSVVVLVDEDKEFDSIIEMKLKSAGFAVYVADVPQAGLRMAGELHPDLILLDINMPGMNGIEFITTLKKDERVKDIKVAFFSNMVNPWAGFVDGKEAFKELGAVTFIDKSIELDRLVEQVRSLVA